jgi:hypothetical protein
MDVEERKLRRGRPARLTGPFGVFGQAARRNAGAIERSLWSASRSS